MVHRSEQKSKETIWKEHHIAIHQIVFIDMGIYYGHQLRNNTIEDKNYSWILNLVIVVDILELE